MQGVHASIRNVFASSVENYIIASRIKQGEDDIEYSTHEEQEDILTRWRRVQYELRKWHAVKAKEEKEKGPEPQPAQASGTSPPTSPQAPDRAPPPKTGFFNTLHMSFDERKALHARKEAWKKGTVESRTPPRLPPRTPSSSGQPDSSSTHSADEDAEFERAIQASVAATSAGNADEDARIEEAIRASVNQVRSMGQGLPGAKGAMDSDDDLQITDEEYQELIEKAIQQSLSVRAGDQDDLLEDDEDFQRAMRESENPILQNYDSDHDEDLKRVLEESKQPSNPAGANGDDEDLRRAIEESMTAHKDEEQRHQAARTEEDIVMEYVKKQSLAEDEYRRQVSRGKAKAGEGEGDEEDEDLKRAMEESLKMTSKAGESSGGGSA